ncbi:hypothetical protein AXG93_509s1040 [Marchantia polymorpha subsp. ruderalis]|uniref:Uncharacterized protein n=1 Tax=Marchantia polymorpha subsp. ruderalis TaxID=1480154 RepID=A0A176WB90_MARPO|nr:hypothetical protein AXG93_509s1040 [Marchantia polymorpha subsp. ruderalis]
MARSVVVTRTLDSARCAATSLKKAVVWEPRARETKKEKEENPKRAEESRRRWILMYTLAHEVLMYDSHTNSFYEPAHNALRNIQRELGSQYRLNLAEESASGLIFCYGVRPTSRHRSMTFGLQIWACNPVTGKVHKLPPYVDLESGKHEIHLTPVQVQVHDVSAGSYHLYVTTTPARAPPPGASAEMKIYRYSSEVRDWTRLRCPFPVKMRIASSTALERFQHASASLSMSEAISSTSWRRATTRVQALRRCGGGRDDESSLIRGASWTEAFKRNGELLLVVVERDDEDLHCLGCSIYSLPSLNLDDPSKSSSNSPLLRRRQQQQSARKGLNHASKPAAAPWKQESHSETKNPPLSLTKLASMPADMFLRLHGNPPQECTKDEARSSQFDVCRTSSNSGNRRTPSQQSTASEKTEEGSCRSFLRVFADSSDDHLLFFSVLTGEIARFSLGSKEWTSSSMHDTTTTTASDTHDGRSGRLGDQIPVPNSESWNLTATH